MIVVNREAVERLMVEKGINKHTLTVKYGLSYVAFENIINGRVNPGLKSIGVLCEALGCQFSDILIKVKND